MGEGLKEDTKKLLKLVALASSVGLSIVLATFIGLAFGLWLDGKFGTKPIFTIAFLIFGIIAGFRNYYLVMKRRSEDQ